MENKNLTFSQALEAFKNEQGIRRPHWPEGETLTLKKGLYPIDKPAANMIHGLHPKLFEFGKERTNIIWPYGERIRPNIDSGTMQNYLSMQDILAQDWEII